MIRLVHLLRRRPDISPRAFAAVWRDDHGPLVASLQTRLDLVRHVQLHRDDSGQDLDLQASAARGGTQPPFDGIADYWWNSEAALQAVIEAGAGRAASEILLDSERRFVDLAASPL